MNISDTLPDPVPAIALPPKRRKNVDFNICELVDAILILIHSKTLPCDNDISTINAEHIYEICQGWLNTPQTVPPCICCNNASTDLQKYMNDFTTKFACVSKRIIAFNTYVIKSPTSSLNGFKYTDVKCVYVSGKNNVHEKIRALNSRINIKQQKSDIYIEYTSGEIVGWSCKQTSDATKSNYSVHKILGPDITKQLNQIKTTYLAENGFTKHSKENRDAVNRLFYPKNKNNPYWIVIRDAIHNNNHTVLDELIKCLTCDTVPYPVYEFDGSSFYNVNNHNNLHHESSLGGGGGATFKEHDDYYKMKNGNERSTAKLFYQLCVAQKKYRVEIRWKGNVHNHSPQFQIHNDDAEDATEPVIDS